MHGKEMFVHCEITVMFLLSPISFKKSWSLEFQLNLAPKVKEERFMFVQNQA